MSPSKGWDPSDGIKGKDYYERLPTPELIKLGREFAEELFGNKHCIVSVLCDSLESAEEVITGMLEEGERDGMD